MNTIHEVLTAAHSLIDSPAKWTQGAWARRAGGYPIMGDWSKAVAYDSSGALRAATGVFSHGNSPQFRDSYTHLEQTLHQLLGRKEYVTVYNDSHSWGEVNALWLRAIETAKAQAALEEPLP